MNESSQAITVHVHFWSFRRSKFRSRAEFGCSIWANKHTMWQSYQLRLWSESVNIYVIFGGSWLSMHSALFQFRQVIKIN